MKAAIVEKPGVLVVRDIPEPQVGEYDVLCKMLYGATCVATDLRVIDGRLPWTINYPTVLGHESVGVVVETGKKVLNFKKGDLITRVGTLTSPGGEFNINWGGFVEFGVARDHWAMRQDGLPQQEWDGFRVNQIVPAGIDPRAATMFITWRETLSYITRMGVGERASMLVVGSGGNGLAFVAHLANLGVACIVMVGNAQRVEIVRAAGATHYFDYKADNLPTLISEACPDGFDFIIDVVGKKGLMDKFLPLLKPGGTIGIYGLDDLESRSIYPLKSRSTFTFYNNHYDEAETHERVVFFVQKGMLKANLWMDIEHPFPLGEINQAYEAVRERKMVKALVSLASRRD